MIYKIVDIFFIEILVGNEILSTFATSKRHEVVSSSSLVRTSGFHPGNSGSNPGETTKTNPNSLKIRVRVFLLHYFCTTGFQNSVFKTHAETSPTFHSLW